MDTKRYDRAITIFSPDGRLFQVDYAMKAAEQGSTVIGICSKTVVVLAVVKRSMPQLKEERFTTKISLLDEHIMMAFAGLNADARVIIDRGRFECQCHKLMCEDPVSVGYIARHIATIKQRYTQSNGRRPFGFSALIAGFDYDGTPRLYQTDPSGDYNEWRATSIGQNASTVREYLERNYSEESLQEDIYAIKLSIKALLEVAQGRNLEVAVMTRDQPLRILGADEISAHVAIIEREKEETESNV